ncbi:MAG: 3-dehydroquinate synthase [Eubacterium sp.]
MKLEEIGWRVKEIQDGGKLAVITDENVGPRYLMDCTKSLKEAGFQVYTFTVPAGEESKSGRVYLEMLNKLAEIPLTRSDGVVALGGGMVGDLAGFTAATYLRGIRVIQVPTTLLAAVDSSVGGKTAINLPEGKNLAGAFHQPELVLQDAELLKSLPKNVLLDGMAEVIKYGMIADENLFSDLKDVETSWKNLENIVETCVSIKKKFVEEDEFDYGVRHLLNFGHTIGHAIEKCSNFQFSHGLSVAKGMNYITAIAVEKGWCEQSVYDELHAMLKEYGFDLAVPYDNASLYDIMCSDKKREKNSIDLVIPKRIGECVRKTVPVEELRELLEIGRPAVDREGNGAE